MKALLPLVAAAALLSGSLGAQAAGSLVFTPTGSTVSPGSSFAVQVRGSGFSDNVVGGGLNLSFDPGVLALTGVSVDTGVWEFASSNGLVDNALGTLSDVYFNSFKAVLPTGDFAVASLQFTALAIGSSALQMTASASFPFANDVAEAVSVTFQPANVTVTAVPEPQRWALFAAGLGVLGALVRHRVACS